MTMIIINIISAIVVCFAYLLWTSRISRAIKAHTTAICELSKLIEKLHPVLCFSLELYLQLLLYVTDRNLKKKEKLKDIQNDDNG